MLTFEELNAVHNLAWKAMLEEEPGTPPAILYASICSKLGELVRCPLNETR